MLTSLLPSPNLSLHQGLRTPQAEPPSEEEEEEGDVFAGGNVFATGAALSRGHQGAMVTAPLSAGFVSPAATHPPTILGQWVGGSAGADDDEVHDIDLGDREGGMDLMSTSPG